MNAARTTKNDEAYGIGLSKGYDKGYEAAEQASKQRIEGLQETVTEVRRQNVELFDLLQKIVNGATRTMGKDSCDYEYAHIRQQILDLGRTVLWEAGRQVNER